MNFMDIREIKTGQPLTFCPSKIVSMLITTEPQNVRTSACLDCVSKPRTLFVTVFFPKCLTLTSRTEYRSFFAPSSSATNSGENEQVSLYIYETILCVQVIFYSSRYDSTVSKCVVTNFTNSCTVLIFKYKEPLTVWEVCVIFYLEYLF